MEAQEISRLSVSILVSLFVLFAALDQVFLSVTVFPALRVLTGDGMSSVSLNLEKCSHLTNESVIYSNTPKTQEGRKNIFRA